jgi:hypothetical protein
MMTVQGDMAAGVCGDGITGLGESDGGHFWEVTMFPSIRSTLLHFALASYHRLRQNVITLATRGLQFPSFLRPLRIGNAVGGTKDLCEFSASCYCFCAAGGASIRSYMSIIRILGAGVVGE